MLLIKRFSAVFAICVFVILTTTTAIAADSGSKYDVVGITLGMTVEDAKQKLLIGCCSDRSTLAICNMSLTPR
jgi:hypothetical protein